MVERKQKMLGLARWLLTQPQLQQLGLIGRSRRLGPMLTEIDPLICEFQKIVEEWNNKTITTEDEFIDRLEAINKAIDEAIKQNRLQDKNNVV